MFVINRLNWHPGRSGFVRLPGEFRVATFATAEEARAEWQQLEDGARALVNPFAGEPAPFEQSNMPEPILCDWLRDRDIDPPDPDAKTGRRDWAKWWETASGSWSAERRTGTWEALDRVRFFEVVEEPDRPVIYGVAEADEHYDLAYYTGLARAYRFRARAEKDCSRRNDEIEGGDYGTPEDDPERRSPLAPFRARNWKRFNFEDRPVGSYGMGYLYHQVVPLEVDGRPKDRLFVVSRIIKSGCSENNCFSPPMEEGEAYAFIRGFGSKEAAEKFCRENVRRAWEVVVPGRFGTDTPPEEIAEGIRKLGLTPPDQAQIRRAPERLALWWGTTGGIASREQRIAVWELLSVPLFEVLETKLVG
jgi:hypothetical protein